MGGVYLPAAIGLNGGARAEVYHEGVMRLNGVDIPEDRLAQFCRRHEVVRLAFFGSILREDFRADSDVDVLVEFATERGPGLFGFAGMQIELTEMLGRPVHLHTAAMLGPTCRANVTQSAAVAYAA